MADVEFRCEVCAFELFIPVVELPTAVLGLYDDSRYPGRCLLALRQHVEDFAELEPPDLLSFGQDMQTAAKAISLAVGAERMNYAILGNAVPHLHAHLIPRQVAGDPVPRRSPWNHPENASSMEPARVTELVREIKRRALELLT